MSALKKRRRTDARVNPCLTGRAHRPRVDRREGESRDEWTPEERKAEGRCRRQGAEVALLCLLQSVLLPVGESVVNLPASRRDMGHREGR